MTKFKQFERYATRNGGTALVLRVDEHGNGTAAIFSARDHYSGTIQFLSNGRLFGASENAWDILPPEPEKVVRWVNVYADQRRGEPTKFWLGSGTLYDSRAAADQNVMTPRRIGCHPIELRAEFVEDGQ